MVKLSVGNDVEIETKPTNDMRSYHISSKITSENWFYKKFTIQDAIDDLVTQ